MPAHKTAYQSRDENRGPRHKRRLTIEFPSDETQAIALANTMYYQMTLIAGLDHRGVSIELETHVGGDKWIVEPDWTDPEGFMAEVDELKVVA